jgi:hypothetical protein
VLLQGLIHYLQSSQPQTLLGMRTGCMAQVSGQGSGGCARHAAAALLLQRWWAKVRGGSGGAVCLNVLLPQQSIDPTAVTSSLSDS